ncbi:DUF2249 domain-containing protein [Thioalkalicoccus limnaeus]|uniref:DUF2249 domain-containing protein n=1 Tax=Thioalkalicoccus limnaeus TaxID=120681 RepID=A0ABV4BIT2_9GAMM
MTHETRVLTLDVQDLPPPEPMERVLETLPELSAGDLLRLRHRREPYPLYRILADQGFRYHVRMPPDCPFEILIWRADGPIPEAAA